MMKGGEGSGVKGHTTPKEDSGKVKQIFEVLEGKHKNDDALSTTHKTLKQALDYAKKSKYGHVLVNEYEGSDDDPRARYINSHYEVGTDIPTK
jgi:hypothetical protein